MRSPTESGPLVHLFVVLATAAVALLIFAAGPGGFKQFLIIGSPWIIGLVVLIYVVRALRKVFSKTEAPFVSSARGLRLKSGTSTSSLKMGRWTVMEDGSKPEEPFASKDKD